MSNLRELLIKRASIKGSLTRFKNFYDKLDTDNPDILQLEIRLNKLEINWEQFCDIQSQIEVLEDNFETENLERQNFEDEYYNCISLAKGLIDSNRQEIHTFKSIIHNNSDISEIQKFHYLRLSLKGEAADIIHSLEISAANYDIAWKLLTERFENKVLLVNNHVKAIFNLPAVNKESYFALRQLFDGFIKHTRALEVLEQPVKHWDTLLIYIISNKLDSITRRDWEKKQRAETLPSLTELTTFLREKCAFLERISPSTSYDKNIKSKAFISNENLTCSLCKMNHQLQICPEFIKLTPNKRFNVVKEHRLCTNCLKSNHKNADCRSNSNCKGCQKRHHSLLHFENIQGESNAPTSRQTNSRENKSENQTVVVHTSVNTSQVLLSTALIKVLDVYGNAHICRVLLDSGSQSNFITQNLVNQLRIEQSKINMAVSGLNNSCSQIKYSSDINIRSNINSIEFKINCLIIPQITDKLPAFSFDKNILDILKNVTLADPNFNESSQVEMLLGASLFWKLLRIGQISLGHNNPVLQKTLFGWIISGEIPQTIANYLTRCNFISNSEIDNQLKKFWQIEEYENAPVSSNDVEIEALFKTTTQRAEDGSFIVRLPLKLPSNLLGESKNIALKRLHSMENKLKGNDNLKQQYGQFMSEYIELNHMSKLQNKRDENDGYLIPHHFVKKESSVTTKLRVVFDASCKTDSGYSLNDLQFVILRKWYRQILIYPDDRKLQKIWWRTDTTKSIEQYELNTVTYGTASAPFLAIRCLHELAYQHIETYPIASKIILNDFYVDDLLTGSDDLEELHTLYHEISLILKSGQFSLNRWVSNSNKILENIYNSQSDVILNIGKENETHTLGLLWHSNSDTSSYTIREFNNQRLINKRTMLSVIAQIYDPLGLLGPVIIILLQKLWLQKIDWDSELPTIILNEWQTFYNQLHHLRNIHIPRHVLCENVVLIQLHGFADASKTSYGACLYLRSIDNIGNCQINLLCAKSKVAPLKLVTIPRLELCAAFLLARLINKVKSSLRFPINRTCLWSDSTITLHWIKSIPSTKLQRVVAYILRFRNNTLNMTEHKEYGPLTCQELENSLKTLIKISQIQTFCTEISDIGQTNTVSKGSNLLQLNPFLDSEGVLRVGGRLTKSNFNFDKKFPIILSGKHTLSKLTVQYEHIRLLHAGPQQVLASLRERYWIISARNLIKKTIHNCVTCFRVKPKALNYLMGDLPDI
ncbi:uncharacterized protein LOC130894154 [Diorhabda carinulata]|uniref:uncharacterized protein LOC130894154 n=1 Tax=Diorhabda carinulata TaxID=1163345 RepID=UPI0025A0E289|nr:uncharacterized protein LOC130894154 [Diorhabda carinulata]